MIQVIELKHDINKIFDNLEICNESTSFGKLIYHSSYAYFNS